MKELSATKTSLNNIQAMIKNPDINVIDKHSMEEYFSVIKNNGEIVKSVSGRKDENVHSCENIHYSCDNLINKINKKNKDGTIFFSLEFFPPKTAQGAANLISK
jgi:hypothetical protein